MPALPSTYIVRIVAGAFQALGLSLTAWRIYTRLKIRRFWWEDVWAVATFFTGLLWMIAQWIFLRTDGWVSIISTWICTISYTCVITCVRMSILFSAIRIIRRGSRAIYFAFAAVAFYVTCWVILIIQKVDQCASNSSWHHEAVMYGKPFCLLKPRISILEFTTDCIAVSMLVVLPLCMLWRVNLPRRQRRMILSILAASVLLAIGAALHTIGQILHVVVVMVAGINFEVAVALIACNLLVVVTYIYRSRSHEHDMTTGDSSISDDDFTTLPRDVQTMISLQLTSIDLDGSVQVAPETPKTTESLNIQFPHPQERMQIDPLATV